MKPIHTDSFHFQTRGVVPQLPSEAQPPTPSGFRERSNQRVKFILEGHGTGAELSRVFAEDSGVSAGTVEIKFC